MRLAVVTAFAREMRGTGFRLQPGPSHVTPRGRKRSTWLRGSTVWQTHTHTHTGGLGPTVTLHHDGTET